MPAPSPKLHDFIATHRRISPYIRHTPLIPSKFLSVHCDADVWLKLDFLQPTGSFKVRGALNKLAQLADADPFPGVVTASAGNHGLGVAYAAEALGLAPVTVFIPRTAPESKRQKLAQYHISVQEAGETYEDAHRAAESFSAESGAQYISAYNDVDIILGQGTCGLEIMLGLPTADAILVPTGGGGLVSGIALATKAINPGTHIFAVQPTASPAAKLSFEQNFPIDPYDHEPTLADGLAGGFGSIPFYLARTLVEDVLLHTESDIRRAVFTLLNREQLLVEPSGAIAIAPLLASPESFAGKTVVCVLTGRNMDASVLADIIRTESTT